MPISRRSLLKAAAAMPALSFPGIVRAESQSTLRFIPVIDLAFVDPIYSTAQVSRNHGFMVYDTLFGMSASLQVSPQMLSGHVISGDGLQWDLSLRDGLFWHDGERVLARDCVASIRRWAARDGFGGELMEATDELSAADDRTIRFRLKRPFPLLPQALGKAAINACFMMPERLASQDPFKPLTEVIGSGPFRYLADERVQGARNAYAKFERYQPRTDGKPDWTAGPKIVHYDRVVWTTTPDAGTGVAALQTGEQDWQETTPHDLLPVIKAAGDIETRILDPRGYACMLRLNHLQPRVRQSRPPPRAGRCDRPVRVHDGGGRCRSRLSGLADRLLRARYADGERGRPRCVPRGPRLCQGQGRPEGGRLQGREDRGARAHQFVGAEAARRDRGR
ncbi:ABC-type transport system substrate-binding protein [Bradyrhizobium japonicum]